MYANVLSKVRALCLYKNEGENSRAGVQRSEGWSSTNPVTPPQPDWEHKHDMAMLGGVPDQILEENNRWRPKNVLTAKKK